MGFRGIDIEYVNRQEIVDAAVRYSYPNIYANFQELQNDYSKFEPEVRYWGSWSWQTDNGLLEKLFGITRYQVRMPEEIVMVTVDGNAEFSRGDSHCPDDNGCPPVPPDNPEQGIVGTVQLSGPTYEVARNLTIQWQGEEKGSVFASGHCFSAYNKSPRNQSLLVNPEGTNTTIIRKGYGFYLVAITSDAYSSMRISKAAFLKSKSCSNEARAAWPNVGGAVWKR